jgi:hypothetical protein
MPENREVMKMLFNQASQDEMFINGFASLNKAMAEGFDRSVSC